jgi:hypothetical protein
MSPYGMIAGQVNGYVRRSGGFGGNFILVSSYALSLSEFLQVCG